MSYDVVCSFLFFFFCCSAPPPRAVAEYAENSQAARTGQHLSRRSWLPELTQDDLTAGKKAAGRRRGQPATADCSGEEGMVTGGDGVGWKGCCCWMVTGSGLGRTGSAARAGRRERRREKSMGSDNGGAAGGCGGGGWDIALNRMSV